VKEQLFIFMSKNAVSKLDLEGFVYNFSAFSVI
jgi:hypothetical protein